MKSEFVAGLLAGGLLLTSGNLLAAASTTGKAETKAAVPGKMSADATKMLHQVNLAREAITAKNTTKAEHDIDAALTERTHLAALAKAKGKSMVIPLYSELDDTSTLGPAMAARNGKTQPNLKAPLAVTDVSSQFTFVGVDLDKAKSRLDAAKQALKNHNDQAASDSLGAIGTDLVMQTNDQDLPLLAIRENLGVARAAVKETHYKEASAALKQASSELNSYAGSGSAQHAAEAKKMRAQIDELSGDVAAHRSKAETDIQQWWQEVDGWFQKHV